MTMRAVVLALLAVAGTAYADDLKVGDRVAELDNAIDANGHAFKVKSIKGWRVLTFGASWCKPCAKELPAWDKIAPEYTGKVTFVAVDLDKSADDGKAFHKKLKISHMQRAYLDPDGVIRYIRGGCEKGDVDGEVKKMKEQLAKLVK